VLVKNSPSSQIYFLGSWLYPFDKTLISCLVITVFARWIHWEYSLSTVFQQKFSLNFRLTLVCWILWYTFISLSGSDVLAAMRTHTKVMGLQILLLFFFKATSNICSIALKIIISFIYRYHFRLWSILHLNIWVSVFVNKWLWCIFRILKSLRYILGLSFWLKVLRITSQLYRGSLSFFLIQYTQRLDKLRFIFCSNATIIRGCINDLSILFISNLKISFLHSFFNNLRVCYLWSISILLIASFILTSSLRLNLTLSTT
jgi:hypothetical protein